MSGRRVAAGAPPERAYAATAAGRASAVAPTLPDLIAQRARVAAIRWPHRPAAATTPGAHRAAALGRGMEFAEVRPYQPGDDPRSLDWRHTARRGRPFTKLFHEERERPVLLLVDLGPTMRFGTRVAFKSVVAARAAALLAWAAADTGDRVGGLVWDGRTHHDVPPRAREAGALELIRGLVRTAAAEAAAVTVPTAGLGAALQVLAGTAGPGTRVAVLSDFQTLDADAKAAERALAQLRRAGALTLVHVFDGLEASPPPPGIYRIGDSRHERTVDLRTPSARAAWGAAFRARRERLASVARRLDAALIPLATHDDPLTALRAPLARR